MDLEQFGIFEMLLGAVVSALGACWLGYRVARHFLLRRYRDRIKKLETQLKEVEDAVTNPEDNLWHRRPIDRPQDLTVRLSSAPPIVSVANLKGGVGKTTLAANLAAYFDRDQGKRVLLVDLDYQGSLSSLCLIGAGQLSPTIFQTNQVVAGLRDGEWLSQQATSLHPVLSRSAISTCFYDFVNLENHLMVEWLTSRKAPDVRFNLAKALTSDEVRSRFDLIILDLPPRQTTGFVNAVASSTHLLVPTVLDRLSAEAVPTFLKQLRAMKLDLAPQLELLGVVPTMTAQAQNLSAGEREALQVMMEEAPQGWGGDTHVFSAAFIPDKAAIARAANRQFAYMDRDCQALFQRLGSAIDARLATVPGWKTATSQEAVSR